MDIITVSVGTVSSGNGGIVQDERQEVVFEAERLGAYTEYGEGRGGGLTDTRGCTQTLFRLHDGRLVIHVKDWSLWQGEPTTERVALVNKAELGPLGQYRELGRRSGFGRPLSIDEALG